MNKFDQAWNYIWEKLFCPKTNLFYDYLADGVDSTSRLPTPEEIAKQFPNPCGWGTGMEDSMMSAGSMLDLVLIRYRKEQNPVFAEMAHKIFKGMKLCAEVSSSPGFLARSVSPVDGHSHFMDSSRDQYTHYVYSAVKFYCSEISTAEEKADIQKIIAGFADRCIRNVTPENEYNLLREDGKPGFVTKMWNVFTHEVMRYPMFCLAAWKVTGKGCYLEVYQKLRDAALAENKKQDLTRNWDAFALLQMQYSLRLCLDLDPDRSAEPVIRQLMRETSQFAQKYVLKVRDMLRRGELKTDAVNPNWRTRLFALYGENLRHGYAYFVPGHEKVYDEACFQPLRTAGQGILIQQLCPDWQIAQEQYDALKEIVESIDYDRLTCYAPILLTGAWFGR